MKRSPIVLLNRILLILMSCIAVFSVFKLMIYDTYYPYVLMIAGSILGVAMFLSVRYLEKAPKAVYLTASALSMINGGILIADYFFPKLLENTWNHSFGITFLLIFGSLFFRLRQRRSRFATMTVYPLLITALLIISILFFQVNSPLFHKISVSMLGLTSILVGFSMVLPERMQADISK